MDKKAQFRLTILLFWLLFGFFIAVKYTFADAFSTFNYLSIVGDNVQEGNIVSVSSNGYGLSTKGYDTDVVGVIQKKDVISFTGPSADQMYPVTKVGKVPVRVSGINGTIQKGDYITTSRMPGIGMKATKPGYTIGIALDSLSSKRTDEIETIEVALNIRYEALQKPIINNTNVSNTSSSLFGATPLWIILLCLFLLMFSTLFIMWRKKISGKNEKSSGTTSNATPLVIQ